MLIVFYTIKTFYIFQKLFGQNLLVSIITIYGQIILVLKKYQNL